MYNVLAILLSMAMMLTGASFDAAPAEMAARTKVIDNITVTVGDEVIPLNPSVHFGVESDGTTGAYDFYIANGENRLLPLQLTVDAGKLLLLNDTSGVTLKLTADDISQMLRENLELPEDAEEMGLLTDITEKLLPAYADMFKAIKDPARMAEIQAKCDEVYDKTVDRGEGTREKLFYEGETLEATSYEYDLDAKQIGALADAACAVDPVLTNYAEAYFSMLARFPEESGMKGADSFEALYAMLPAEIKLHIAESIADNGLRIQNGVLTCAMEGVDQPMQMEFHSEKHDDEEYATVNTTIGTDGVTVDFSMDYNRKGTDLRYDVTITGNPASEEAKETDEGESEIGDAAGDAGENTAEDAEFAQAMLDDDYEGEGDGEDMLYATLSFNWEAEKHLSITGYIDAAEGVTASYSADATADGDNWEAHVEASCNGDAGNFGCAFDVHLNGETFDIRTREDGALSKDEMNFEVLLAGLGSDALKLYTDDSVQRVVEQFRALQAAAEPEVEDDDAGDEDAKPAELTFANPRFEFLPEGYNVSDTMVDAENGFVSVTFTNADNSNIYLSMNEAWTGDATVSQYAIRPEGGYDAVDGMLVTREDYGDYVIYTAEDGTMSYSASPEDKNVAVDDMIKLFAGIQFD